MFLHKLFIFSVFFVCSFFTRGFGSEQYLTQVPKNWQCIDDPAQLPKKIKVIYVGKGKPNNPFTPSINIACEETTLALHDYVLLAKNYHEGQSGTQCTFLGQLKTEAGLVEILQIDKPSQWGPVRFIQAMLIDNGESYVITATCLKEDFASLSSQLIKAIQSFSIPTSKNHCTQIE